MDEYVLIDLPAEVLGLVGSATFRVLAKVPPTGGTVFRAVAVVESASSVAIRDALNA